MSGPQIDSELVSVEAGGVVGVGEGSPINYSDAD
jgi:hypothetical protein